MGIKPGSPGALVELNNKELGLKAQSVVAQLRQYRAVMEAKATEINKQLSAKKISKDQAATDHLSVLKEISEDFNNNVASDAYNVENELRSRLGPAALSHVVIPGFVGKGPNGAVDPHSRVTFAQLMRGLPFDDMWIGGLADEIDQMAKLLPSDPR